MKTAFYISLLVLVVLVTFRAHLPAPKPTAAAPSIDPALLLKAATLELQLLRDTRAHRQQILELESIGYGARPQLAAIEARAALEDEQRELERLIADLEVRAADPSERRRAGPRQ